MKKVNLSGIESGIDFYNSIVNAEHKRFERWFRDNRLEESIREITWNAWETALNLKLYKQNE